ncbi:PhzF family phenazine biosynthesis protein [Lutibaculum baratangense]|uniref:Phenazine biosynthesis protein n=1 Tax=Lutibaculum baratangense AMV1 TaxID=631454 RepID=V4RLR7_9HYPH|nr:PhzF family phenazine biosynthesis protein [Lutibaculum baratangense]ESR24195.1 Phenazine biosynthesis protein [Lutibaculum baratangense AMV1]
MSRRYYVLDVFTDEALSGNPLAVVLDAEGLDTERMQAIAKEFNLSETVFVLPAEGPAHTAKLRIFTPGREIPFAGHPTVGTGILMARQSWGESGEIEGIVTLEEEIGLIRLGVVLRDGHAFAEFDVPAKPAALEPAPDRELAAAALGLFPSEIGFENHKPSRFEAGNAFAFVPVRNFEVLRRIKIERRTFDKAFPDGAAYVYCRETMSTGNDFHARMFAPAMGVAEDPATGSAAAAFAGVIMKFDQPTGGHHRYRIEQGHIMGRPSLVELEIEVDGGLDTVRIGGAAVIVAEGSLLL